MTRRQENSTVKKSEWHREKERCGNAVRAVSICGGDRQMPLDVQGGKAPFPLQPALSTSISNLESELDFRCSSAPFKEWR